MNLRKPSPKIIYKYPEKVALRNATTVINSQNPDITLTVEDFTAKFMYNTSYGK